MRSLWTFLLPALGSSVIAGASAPPAEVYLYDPGNKASTSQPQEVDPTTARLIFSHRLGLSQFESLQNVGDKVIEQLNAFGGLSHQLFGQSQKGAHEHGFIVVEGVNNAKDFMVKNRESYQSFHIADPPSSVSALLTNLVDHADSISRKPDSPWRNTYNAEQIGDVFESFLKAEEHWSFTESRGPITFLSFGDLAAIEQKYGAKSNFYKDAETRLQQAFDNLIELSRRENFSLTVLFMPRMSHQMAKRAEDGWGSMGSILRQKQAPELIETDSTAPSAKSTSPKSAAQIFANEEAPLRGPIKSCFSSLDECQSGTRNCTGHGECVAKFKTEAGTCFGCACTIPDVRTNPNGGKKTTTYGGAACHKKDVSIPFWLFAGFTVAMAGLLSAGIGLLYSMGSEELPSVIGAGVSGPKAR